jgi:hypothetical protein
MSPFTASCWHGIKALSRAPFSALAQHGSYVNLMNRFHSWGDRKWNAAMTADNEICIFIIRSLSLSLPSDPIDSRESDEK